MASASLATAKLGLSAQSINLTSSLIAASNSSNSLVQLFIEIGQWLGREKLTRHELQECFVKARGVVNANEKGNKLFDEMNQGLIGLSSMMPLLLKQSGSVARYLARDPDLCWIISTATSLFQFHPEHHVSDAICSMIMLAQRDSEGRSTPNLNEPHHPARIQVKSVVGKLVSSIWFNVVNSGNSTLPLPQELVKVCPRGHYLTRVHFAKAALELAQNDSQMILQSQHLLRNITLWLYLHFDGLLRVIVSGKIIFEETLGQTGKSVELRITSFCDDIGTCNYELGEEHPEYQILKNISGHLPEVLLSSYRYNNQAGETVRPEPRVRQKLYHPTTTYSSESRLAGSSLQMLLRCTAQEITRWFLGLRITTLPDALHLGFSVSSEHQTKISNLKILDLLKRSPAILNMVWGDRPPSRLVVSAPIPERTYLQMKESALKERKELTDLLPYFPILRDLVRETKPHCRCLGCRQPENSEREILSKGCLQHDVLEEVMVLVAHAIADGFGANDTSANTKPAGMVAGIVDILESLVAHKKIFWDHWFMLSASIFLGCPYQASPMALEFAGTTYAAIQYGNLAAIASWLDISKKMQIRGCFGLLEGRGKLTVAAHSDGEERFHSIEENEAIIQTAITENTGDYVARFEKSFRPVGEEVLLGDDISPADYDVMLVSASETTYRLLTRVQSATHSRIVDPSAAMIKLAKGVSIAECLHRENERLLPFKLGVPAKIYSFDEVLGRWPGSYFDRAYQSEYWTDLSMDERQRGLDRRGSVHLTAVFDTFLKQNVALALSIDDVAILNPQTSCLSCGLQQMEAEHTEQPDTINGPARRVISLAQELDNAERRGPRRRQIK